MWDSATLDLSVTAWPISAGCPIQARLWLGWGLSFSPKPITTWFEETPNQALPPYPPPCRFPLHPIPVPRKLKMEARKGLAGCGSFSFGCKAKRRASWVRLQIGAASAHLVPQSGRPGSGRPFGVAKVGRVIPAGYYPRCDAESMVCRTPRYRFFLPNPRDGRWRKDQG